MCICVSTPRSGTPLLNILKYLKTHAHQAHTVVCVSVGVRERNSAVRGGGVKKEMTACVLELELALFTMSWSMWD